jgi:sulfatase modifying factor 1
MITTPATLFPYTEDRLPDGNTLDMVFVKGGEYNRGSEEVKSEQPVREVSVPDFYIGRYPVTNAEYARFLNAYKSEVVKEGDFAGQEMIYEHKWGLNKQDDTWYPAKYFEDHPVVYVTWFGAWEYCQWLRDQTDMEYRLLSEAEWEYAARGGQESKGFQYAGGDNLKQVGWFWENSHKETKQVRLKQPNELGIFDMSGNVWEWCMDHWHENYESAPPDGGPWLDEGQEINYFRVLRGGSWLQRHLTSAGSRIGSGTMPMTGQHLLVFVFPGTNPFLPTQRSGVGLPWPP